MNPTESTAPQGDAELTTTSRLPPWRFDVAAELEELDNLLDDLHAWRRRNSRSGSSAMASLTAVICSRRPIAPAEYLPMLLGDGAELEVAEGEPLPLLPAFADAAQQARFWSWGSLLERDRHPARHRREDAGRRTHLPARSDGHARRRGQPA